MNTTFGPRALVALPHEAVFAAALQGLAIASLAFAADLTTTSSVVVTPIPPDSTSATLRTVAPAFAELTSATEGTGKKIAEARRLSGLTWEELARAMALPAERSTSGPTAARSAQVR